MGRIFCRSYQFAGEDGMSKLTEIGNQNTDQNYYNWSEFKNNK